MARAAMKPAQLSEALRAVEDARIAARLSAETIAAQQAALRAEEGKRAAAEIRAERLVALLGEIRAFWAGGDCPDDLWEQIVQATQPTEVPPSWKRMDRIQRPETYK